jgi:hypothetical protein
VLQSNCTLREHNSAISTVLGNSSLTRAKQNDNKLSLKVPLASMAPMGHACSVVAMEFFLRGVPKDPFFARCYIKYSSLMTPDIYCDILMNLLCLQEPRYFSRSLDWLRAGARDFSPLHEVQTSSGAHPTSYPV